MNPVRNTIQQKCKRKISNRTKTSKIGIIILGHGSKAKKANGTIPRVIKEIKKKAGITIIEPSYLQLSRPDLHASVKGIVERGCKKIVIVPFFLFTGNHVGRDIHNEIGREKKIYKGVEFLYAKNLGADPRISDIVLSCIKEVL